MPKPNESPEAPCAASDSEGRERDPLLELRGSGAEAWRDESPDAYVARVRSDWSRAASGE